MAATAATCAAAGAVALGASLVASTTAAAAATAASTVALRPPAAPVDDPPTGTVRLGLRPLLGPIGDWSRSQLHPGSHCGPRAACLVAAAALALIVAVAAHAHIRLSRRSPGRQWAPPRLSRLALAFVALYGALVSAAAVGDGAGHSLLVLLGARARKGTSRFFFFPRGVQGPRGAGPSLLALLGAHTSQARRLYLIFELFCRLRGGCSVGSIAPSSVHPLPHGCPHLLSFGFL